LFALVARPLRLTLPLWCWVRAAACPASARRGASRALLPPPKAARQALDAAVAAVAAAVAAVAVVAVVVTR
jgi:hypothetical protein